MASTSAAFAVATCAVCHKASSEFYTSNRVTCKACVRARAAAWRKANPERHREATRRWRQRRLVDDTRRSVRDEVSRGAMQRVAALHLDEYAEAFEAEAYARGLTPDELL